MRFGFGFSYRAPAQVNRQYCSSEVTGELPKEFAVPPTYINSFGKLSERGIFGNGLYESRRILFAIPFSLVSTGSISFCSMRLLILLSKLLIESRRLVSCRLFQSLLESGAFAFNRASNSETFFTRSLSFVKNTPISGTLPRKGPNSRLALF